MTLTVTTSRQSTTDPDTTSSRPRDQGIPAEADPVLIAAVKDGLAAVADPARAPKMWAYMKSDMSYVGVALPTVRAVTKAAAREHPPTSVIHLGSTAAILWRGATYREHRYAATELASLRMADGALELSALRRDDRHRGMVGPRRRGCPAPGPAPGHAPQVAAAAAPSLVDSTGSMVATCQHHRPARCQGARTDVDLLSQVIDANATDPDFFVRKAIGWFLRDYARTEPEWVRDFVGARVGILSGLSRREATKHLA